MTPRTETLTVGERPLRWEVLGRAPYLPTLERMEATLEAVHRGEQPDTVFLVEHEPVLTLGRAAKKQNLLLAPQALEARGVSVVETGRGGDVTYHGPGQWVLYPVIDLRPERKDVRRYVAGLEQVMLDTLRAFGIEGHRREGEIGAWVGERKKIGSIGVRISRWITSHGLALNVSPDLTHFSWIVPCGLPGVHMTSMSEMGVGASMEEVAEVLKRSFIEVLGPRRPRVA